MRRRPRLPVLAGALLAALVVLAAAGVTGLLTSGGPEDARTSAAAAPAPLDPAAASGPASGEPAAVPAVPPTADSGPVAAAEPGDRAPAGQRRPAAARPPAPAATPRMIMIIRHGEQPEGAAGQAGDRVLSSRGSNRARSLGRLFAPDSGPRQTGIARPKTIFAVAPTGQDADRRTRDTVTPLADELGIPVDTGFGKGQEAALARSAVARSGRGPVLISWEHGGIPRLGSELKVVGPRPPAAWPDSRHDLVWTFTQAGPDTWRFSQTPQLLLPGDSGRVIR